MKVFISVAMRGRSKSDIIADIEMAQKRVSAVYPEARFINAFVDEDPAPDNRLYCLGESIKILGTCDALYLCPGWLKANGCNIELEVARRYGIKILNEEIA